MSNPRSGESTSTAVTIERTLDLSALLGDWRNTNDAATGIARLLLTQAGDQIFARIFGAGHPDPFDWGEAPAEVFAEIPESMQPTSFTFYYDLGFMSVWLQTYLAKGVLVVVSFTRFQDSSGRSNYFGKEFFFRSQNPVAVK